MDLIISEEHGKALKAINDDYFYSHDLGEVINSFIEEYVLRENGRLGHFSEGKYIDA